MSFGYDADAAPTIDSVTLAVPAGSTLAIVGETGSGKTTLGYLVARLYEATAGRVSIDGVDVRDVTFASLAETVGMVSQETYLLHATIRENLRFAKPTASDAELEAAARAAQIHELVAALPDGYDTVVGERGYRFSYQAGRSSASRSPGPSCATRPCWCSTRPRARWTTRPSAPSKRRSTVWPRGARRSRSPTG